MLKMWTDGDAFRGLRVSDRDEYILERAAIIWEGHQEKWQSGWHEGKTYADALNEATKEADEKEWL